MPASSLAERIAFLSNPACYPERTQEVEVIETHMSWVFLTDRFAYKMKKPVAYDYLDFSTVQARRFYVSEEIRLNRRLAQSVYLGAVPLTSDGRGGFEFSGEGEALDWLVLMRRLTSQLALDQCIRNQRLPVYSIDKLGEKLAYFYADRSQEIMSCEAYHARFVRNIDEIMAELVIPEHDMPMSVVNEVARLMRGFLRQKTNMFDDRVSAGRVIEGHGDLRAEHVYLENDPVVVDCIEFSRDLRVVDSAFDLSFLVLECERLGAPKLGDKLFEIYRGIVDDHPPEEMIHFYHAYHACSRARIALWHLKEEQYRGSLRWRSQAGEWLALAQHHARQMYVRCR